MTTEEVKQSIESRNESIETAIDGDLRIARDWHGSWEALRERIKILEDNEKEGNYERAYRS